MKGTLEEAHSANPTAHKIELLPEPAAPARRPLAALTSELGVVDKTQLSCAENTVVAALM
jgi:hypothetical protein